MTAAGKRVTMVKRFCIPHHAILLDHLSNVTVPFGKPQHRVVASSLAIASRLDCDFRKFLANENFRETGHGTNIATDSLVRRVVFAGVSSAGST